MQLFYPEHLSVLQAEMLVEWKRGRGLYNFETLPSKAIICVDYSVCKHLDSFFSKKIKGLKGRNFVAKDLLVCTGFDNGGSGIINLLEELRALRVEQFFFIGFGGILSNQVKEGEVYAIDKALSCSGITQYYCEKNELTFYDHSLFYNLTGKLNLDVSSCVSVDTAFRETKPLLEEAISKGAKIIEMECAAIYSFGEYYKLSTVCFLMAADSLIENWHSPKDLSKIQNELKRFVSELQDILSSK